MVDFPKTGRTYFHNSYVLPVKVSIARCMKLAICHGIFLHMFKIIEYCRLEIFSSGKDHKFIAPNSLIFNEVYPQRILYLKKEVHMFYFSWISVICEFHFSNPLELLYLAISHLVYVHETRLGLQI